MVDQWSPSKTTQHEMGIEKTKVSVEEQKAGDDSQNSARSMVLTAHTTPFDVFVDGLNRLVRPAITYWIIGGLIGFWSLPRLGEIDPMMGNIIWTVITFWFGSRMLFKDIPAAYWVIKKLGK